MKKMCIKINELSDNKADFIKDDAFRLALEEVFEEWQNSDHGLKEVDDYCRLLDAKDLKVLRESSFYNNKISGSIRLLLLTYYSDEDDEGNALISAEELLRSFKVVTNERGKLVYPVWKNQLFNMLCGIDREFSGMSEEKLNQIGVE